MVNENRPERTRNEEDPIVVVGAAFITLLLCLICALTGSLLPRWGAVRPAPIPSIPVASAPTATPTVPAPTALPVIPPGPGIPTATQTGPQILPGEVWEVIKIRDLGYALGDQRYDLARFRRLGVQETAKGYCLDPGRSQPGIGARYVLNERGIFVQLDDLYGVYLQRFKLIQ
jgi:hypothetical protein